MKAVIVWNDSCLTSEQLSALNCEYFYCLFDKDNLYTEDDSHFFVQAKDLFSNQELKESFKLRRITEINLHSPSQLSYSILDQFTLNKIKCEII